MPLLLLLLACGPSPADRVMVVTAARDLSVGVPIGESDVYGFAMEARYLPSGVFLNPDDVIGRVPHERILANEPIRARRLADPELQAELAAMVPPDLEVVTFPLDERAARPPLPGQDRVDVRVGERVVVSALPVLRVDRNQVAAMASRDQMRAIAEARPNAVLTVDLSP